MPHPPARKRRTPGLALSLLAGLTALVSAGCIQRVQRLPGPLPPLEDPDGPSEPPALNDVSTLEALVQRHSDPVWIRRPAALDDYPLPFYRKRERVTAGTVVRTGYGGRAELIWPGDASNVVLFDHGAVRVANPETDEMLVEFLSVTRCLIHLTPEDRVLLPGGSVLRGDPVEPSGPYQLEHFDPQYLRLTNQTKRPAQLIYREAEIELGPGESIDLPRLGDTAPRPPHPAQEELQGGKVSIVGRVEPHTDAGSIRMKAVRPSEVFSQGVRVRLAPDEQVTFQELSPPSEFPEKAPPGNSP